MDMSSRHVQEMAELLARQAVERLKMEEEEVPEFRKVGWLQKPIRCPLEACIAFTEIKQAILYLDSKIHSLQDDGVEMQEDIDALCDAVGDLENSE